MQQSFFNVDGETSSEDDQHYDSAVPQIAEDWCEAVENGRLEDIYRLKYFIDNLDFVSNRKQLAERIRQHELYQRYFEDAQQKLEDWKKNLKMGDSIDVFKVTEGKWYHSKILEIAPERSTPSSSSSHDTGKLSSAWSIRVHYQGWGKKYDETIHTSEVCIAPEHAFTTAKKKATKMPDINRNAPLGYAIEVIPESEVIVDPATGTGEAAEAVGSNVDANSSSTSSTRYGRRVRNAVNPSNVAAGAGGGAHKKEDKTAVKKSKKKEGGDDEDKDNEEEDEDDEDKPDLNDWVCGVCGWLEAPDGSDLVLCEGFCRRSFHLGCLGLLAAPEQLWYCDDCIDGEHCCFVCGFKGKDNIDVIKCNMHACGKFYHPACLSPSAGSDGSEESAAVAVAAAQIEPPQHSLAADDWKAGPFQMPPLRIAKTKEGKKSAGGAGGVAKGVACDVAVLLERPLTVKVKKNNSTCSKKTTHGGDDVEAAADYEDEDFVEAAPTAASKISNTNNTSSSSSSSPDDVTTVATSSTTAPSASASVSASATVATAETAVATATSPSTRGVRIDFKTLNKSGLASKGGAGTTTTATSAATTATIGNGVGKTVAQRLRYLVRNNNSSSSTNFTNNRGGDSAGSNNSNQAVNVGKSIEANQRGMEFSMTTQRVVLENKVPKFRCPHHYCHNCYSIHGVPKGSGLADLNKCLLCPRAYHTNCIPPGSRFNSMCVLCPLHPRAALPAHNQHAQQQLSTPSALMMAMDNSSSNISGGDGDSSYGMVAAEAIFWDQLAIPDVCPEVHQLLGSHFRLQCHLKESVEAAPVSSSTQLAPPNFKSIRRNDYEYFTRGGTRPVPQASFVPEVSCDCAEDCDESCLNRVLRIECCEYGSSASRAAKDDAEEEDGGGGGRGRGRSGPGSRSICNVGAANCSNRMLQRRKYAKTKVFQEFQMGWGLKAMEFIPQGQLIIEYVGEMIDHAEVQRRMEAQRINTPQDRDFYIMEIDNGMFVDGKFKGSVSRFINHSCDPNCELQRWIVKGLPRIAIVAIKDIDYDQPLSYDYRFDTQEAAAFQCFCGAANCRGSMAPDKKGKAGRGTTASGETITYDSQGIPIQRSERRRLLAVGRQVLKASHDHDKVVEKEWSCSYTSSHLPGDAINEVKSGPVRAAVKAGASAALLLKRSVYRGAQYTQRDELLVARGKKRPLIAKEQRRLIENPLRSRDAEYRRSQRAKKSDDMGAGADAGADADVVAHPVTTSSSSSSSSSASHDHSIGSTPGNNATRAMEAKPVEQQQQQQQQEEEEEKGTGGAMEVTATG